MVAYDPTQPPSSALQVEAYTRLSPMSDHSHLINAYLAATDSQPVIEQLKTHNAASQFIFDSFPTSQFSPPHSILAYREGTHHAVYVDAAHVYHVGGHAPPGAEPVPEGGHFLNVPRWTPEAADAVYPYADEFAFCTHNACDGSTCEAITRSVATYAPADQLLVPRFGRMSTGGRAPRERSRPE